MPASQVRTRQPVDAVAEELAKLLKVSCFGNITVKAPSTTGKTLKNLNTKEEKVQELAGRLTVNDAIATGKWNVLLLDDLYPTGASLEGAANALRTYGKTDGIYVAALTWR
nr:ComF family protein [Rhizobium sp. Q54]